MSGFGPKRGASKSFLNALEKDRRTRAERPLPGQGWTCTHRPPCFSRTEHAGRVAQTEEGAEADTLRAALVEIRQRCLARRADDKFANAIAQLVTDTIGA